MWLLSVPIVILVHDMTDKRKNQIQEISEEDLLNKEKFLSLVAAQKK